MKHRLLISLLLGGMAIGASAQTVTADLTSKLQNADFSKDSPVASTIFTYDYNMPDDGAGAGGTGLFGMQLVTGWTANQPTDNIKVMQSSSDPDRGDGTNAKACGVFAYEDDGDENVNTIGLGGAYYAPYINDGITTTTNALGMVSVWGSAPVYSQNVSLSSGAYMLVVTLQNVAGTGTITNKIGFIAGDGTEYLSTKDAYELNVWTYDTITFRLPAATDGQVQLGLSFGSGSGSAPHLFIDNVKLYQIDEQELIQKDIDEAKEELQQLVNLGKVYGVDTSVSQAVINNPSATLEQVKAQIEKQKEINASGVTDLSPYFFNNPHFDEDDPLEGGICTYDYDCEKNGIPLTNYSMLPLSGWERTKTDNGCAAGVYAVGSGCFLGGVDFIVPTTMSDGSTEGKVLGLVTCWSMSVQYKQTCTLPAGQYTLKFSYYNAGGTTAITKNLIGFVADNGDEYLGTNTTFPVGKWTMEEINFTLAEETTGYFTMGYSSPNVGSANVPHFFTDGIQLFYVGNIDPSVFALKAAVSTGNKLLDEYFQQSMKDELEQKVEAAQALLDSNSTDSDANTAAAQAVTSMVNDVHASIDAFNRLREFFDGEFADTYEKYETTSLKPQLDEMSDNISEQVDDVPTWTVDEINECIASLPGIIKVYVQEQFDQAVATGTSDGDLDISVLYGDLLGATYSTSALQGTSVVDKQWNYGDAGNFKTQYGTMEVWNQSPFTVSQTMTNMPAGTYTLKTRAFYRTADQVTNYSEYTASPADYAYVFAGNLKTPLSNIAEIASSNVEEFSASNSAVGENSDLYVPNSQQAAYNVFENKFRDYDETTLKSVQTVLTSEGDLTFGVTADQMQGNAWVVWYTFELYYNPVIDENIVDDELTAVLEEVNSYLEENESNMSSSAARAAKDVIDQANNAKESGTNEQKSKAITDLKATLEDAKANVKAYEAYNAAVDNLTNVFSEYQASASPEALAAAEELLTNSDPENMTTAELEEGTVELNKAAARLKIPDSSNPPCDFTQVIDNNSFEMGDLTGWTAYIGGDTGAKEVANETYFVENADGAYLFNTWNGSAPADGFYVSQTLYCLPAGTYKLEALLASDINSEISLSAAGFSETFTMENEKNIAMDCSLTFMLGEETDVEIKASSPKWFKADYFRLTYVSADALKKGDVNGDTKVDISDVVAIINTMAGDTKFAGTSDVNGDGKTDISDVVMVINIMAGQE